MPALSTVKNTWPAWESRGCVCTFSQRGTASQIGLFLIIINGLYSSTSLFNLRCDCIILKWVEIFFESFAEHFPFSTSAWFIDRQLLFGTPPWATLFLLWPLLPRHKMPNAGNHDCGVQLFTQKQTLAPARNFPTYREHSAALRAGWSVPAVHTGHLREQAIFPCRRSCRYHQTRFGTKKNNKKQSSSKYHYDKISNTTRES